MIANRAIRKFLERPRKDYRTNKRFSSGELAAYRDLLPVDPPIWKPLKIHQKVCFLIGAKTKRFAFFLDTGMGKTLLSIALILYFRKLQQANRVLVLVPARVNKWEWVREIKKHSPGISYQVLTGSSVHKWERLKDSKALIVIETYAGFIRMVCTLQPARRKKKNRLVPDAKLVKIMQQTFQGLILDESTAVKRKSSLPSRICRQLAKTVQFLFPLTGTPFGRDPTDLWAQVQLVDGGYTLGETLGLFRAAFFTEKQNYWGGVEYKFIKKKEGQLNQFLANSCIRYEADEADLPRVVPIRKYVSLPEDAHSYYEKAKLAIRKSKGNVREIRNAFLRMRQISSGFVGYFDDEAGSRAEFVFPYNPKLEMLLTLIESIREDRKIIVCMDFIWSGDRIAKELDERKIGWVRIAGSTKNPSAALHKFDNNPKARVLILSNAMVMGLNLQVANYQIFYESPVPAIMRKQAERRMERQETKHSKVFRYDLIVRGTVDERILEFHRSGKKLFDAIVNGKIKL